jgi:DNA-binding NarL/FixJ family response regulator
MKVLLIEDEENYRLIFGKLLHDHLEIVYATTLQESLEVLAKERFDCVLLDPGLTDSMPKDTVKTLMDRNPDANVLVISGHTDPDAVAAALKAGANGYLSKGKDDLRAEDLMRVIKDAVINCKSKTLC